MASESCVLGCECGRHQVMGRMCLEGCICARHSLRPTWWTGKKCLDGCACDKHSEVTRRRISLVHRGQPKSDEHRRRLSVANAGQKRTEETRRRVGEASRGRKWPLAARERRSQLMLQRWQDPVEARKMRLSQGTHPNGLEMEMGEMLTPYGFRYVGDGSYLVACKSPDFWNGENLLVEVYGDYWHRGHRPEDRIRFFNERGYGCLVIWESELRADKDGVLARVQAFASGGY